MSFSRQSARIIVTGLMLAALACGGPQQSDDPEYRALTEPTTQQPMDAVDRAILSRIEELEPDKPVDIEGASVIADAAYHAASGRTCRNVIIRGDAGERARLACQMDEAWAFVPDVLGPMAGGQSP